jgi:hypothetical protein
MVEVKDVHENPPAINITNPVKSRTIPNPKRNPIDIPKEDSIHPGASLSR